MQITLQALVDLARQMDPGIRDIILIGSAVYAPDLARDFDLVITTTSAGDKQVLFDRLFDALNGGTAGDYLFSLTSIGRLSQRTIYLVYGRIRDLRKVETSGTGYIIDIRPYVFGTPAKIIDRTPVIRYMKDQGDD